MKKLVSKILTLCVAVALFALSLASNAFAPIVSVSAQTALKPIDVYLIGGQSNAAGYSNKGDIDGEWENIMYAGQTEPKKENPLESAFGEFMSDTNYWRTSVTEGLGASATKIGPEWGMAKVLNSSYSSSKKAIIFKTAAGGTALSNDCSAELCIKFGNWYPRSLWSTGYTPTLSSGNSPTGVLYYRFVENFRNFYNALVNEGYQPVVKGMAWMQGEQDLGKHALYEGYLKAFITDLRTDLVDITGDQSLAAMPFVIGEIASTFASYGNTSVPPFVAVQRKVAADMDAVYTVPTDDLIIVGANGVVGTDKYHFSGADAETLGMRFGNKLAEAGAITVPAININDAQMGSVAYTLDAEGKITLNFALNTANPDKKYKLAKVEVEGVDITSQIVNGSYTFAPSSTKPVVSVTFTDYDNFAVSYDYDDGKCGALSAPEKVYSGDTLKFKFGPAKGYYIARVKVNGVVVEPSKIGNDGKSKTYEVENITQNQEVEITVLKDGETLDTTTAPTSGGCANAVSTVLAAIGALVAVVFLIKK